MPIEEPDYTTYSLDSLVDALSHIDRERHPERFARLKAEYSSRSRPSNKSRSRKGKPDQSGLSPIQKPPLTLASRILLVLAGLALVAVSAVVGTVFWYATFYVGHQHRTNLGEWTRLSLYASDWVTIEMPEGHFRLQLHEYPPTLIGDSDWDVTTTPCVTTPDRFHCACVLPENYVLSFPDEEQDAWREWIAQSHSAVSKFVFHPRVADYKRNYPIEDGWEFMVHIRYFSGDYDRSEVAQDEAAIRRILNSVEITGEIPKRTIDYCIESATRHREWIEFKNEQRNTE